MRNREKRKQSRQGKTRQRARKQAETHNSDRDSSMVLASETLRIMKRLYRKEAGQADRN